MSQTFASDTAEPATVPMVEYAEASEDVRAVFDDIMATKKIDFIPNAWKVFASHPPTLSRLWYGLKEVMAPGALDPKFKEMIAVAVSATNGCDYCTRSHTAAARKLGMTDGEYGELLAVVGMFNQTNALAEAYKVPVDEVFLRSWSDPK
jgi:AhpD family alkylhydroperoxidase